LSDIQKVGRHSTCSILADKIGRFSVLVSNYKLDKQKLLLLISRNHMFVQTFLKWLNRVCCNDILW